MYELSYKAHVTGYVFMTIWSLLNYVFPNIVLLMGSLENVFSLTYFGDLFDEEFFGTHGLKILTQSMHEC